LRVILSEFAWKTYRDTLKAADVFEVEPLPPSAAASDGHGRRVAKAFAANLARWAQGQPLLNVADPD
jgi:phosphoglycerate dehydrogenase-like enzyme